MFDTVPAAGFEYWYGATLVRVVDGDTVVLHLDLGFGVILRNKHFRLFGINAPDYPDKEGKTRSTLHLNTLVQGKVLMVNSIKDKADKYGDRWLGIVFTPDCNVNERMVADGFAVAWDGKGTKPA